MAVGAAGQLKAMLKSLNIDEGTKFQLMRLADAADPNMQPARALTQEELAHVKDLLFNKSRHLDAEHKLAFLYQFGRVTHDWQNVWNEADFFRLVTEQELKANERGKFGQFLVRTLGASAAERFYEGVRNTASSAEMMVYGAGRTEAQAMANNVAISELYRQRGQDIRHRIKTPGFLDGLEMPDADKKLLYQDYNNYANSFQRFFVGWMDSVTRDPRGSSTQWGRQWYLQTMYHRGGAMHPESFEFAGERTFLSPIGWFMAQTFHRASAANWMFGSPFVRIMRGFQTATYGYPTMWDKNLTPSGEFDLMAPWQQVHYSTYQKVRALTNPAETVFSLQKFNPAMTFARSLQLVPGLNMLSYFFPSLDPAQNGGNYDSQKWAGKTLSKNIGEYSWYNALASVPGMGSIMKQSQTQQSQRAGMDIVNALKQKPEDFTQYKGGAFVHHFTDSANPGVSYVDYTGRGRLAARMASYLTRDVTGKYFYQHDEGEKWKEFFSGDEYVRRQATFSMARRGIAAEVKRMQFQEEFTGYGPAQNPMWAPLSSPSLLYWLGKGATSGTGMAAGALWAGATGGAAAAVPAAQAAYRGYESWKDHAKRKQEALAAGRQPPSINMMKSLAEWAKRQKAELRHQTVTCPYCNTVLMGKAGACRNCGRYVR